jgi:hypothetical protein
LLLNICFPWFASKTEATTETNGLIYFQRNKKKKTNKENTHEDMILKNAWLK